MKTIKRDGGWMGFEIQAHEKGLTVIAKTFDNSSGSTCSHITLTPADLATLGYVPKPVWRETQRDSPEIGKTVIGLLDGLPVLAVMDSRGMFFNAETKDWLGRIPSKWTDIPALPGKGEK